MKLRFLLLACFFTCISFAQNFEISGKVVDENLAPLGSATIYLEKAADSTLVTYTISEGDGSFTLVGKSSDAKLDLFVSYAGYQPYFKTIEVKSQNLGNLAMNVQSNELGEITVTAERSPVSIKSDTLEFNAASFKTRDNANLEEVLKELPGVSVDNEGNITVNGKPVSRILVNGKEFFGDDPKIATKNLPKEIIDKIQVVDTKTKDEEFTGKEGDSENKTINITIEEDKNRGYFTRLTAGGGTDDRYELSGISNYFKDKLRVSLLASSNNINSSGFTFDEVFDAMGRNAYSISTSSNGNFSINGNSYGGGTGITETDNIGLNFVNEWAENTELSVNYFYNHSDNISETKIERENILPDRRFFTNSNSSANRLNDNNRFSIGFSTQPDTLTRISIRPNFNISNSKAFSDSFTESLQEDGTRINNATTKTSSDVLNSNFSNRVYVSRRFGKGGSYSFGFNNENENRLQKDFFYSEREIFDDNGSLEETQIQDQLIDEDNKSNNYGAFTSMRLPVAEDWDLDFEIQFDSETAKNERLVYNNAGANDYTDLDESLSNDFRSKIQNFQPNAGISYNNDTLRVAVSAGLYHTRLQNVDLFSETKIDNTYNNFTAHAYLNYKLSKSKSIYFSYRNDRETPRISELQPVSITTNPLNIITGNPNLDPSFRHNIYINFNNYDFATRSGSYAYIGGGLVNSDVVPITFTDDNLVRTTTYTNVDGAYNFFGGFNFDKKFELNETTTLKVEPGLNANYSKRLGFSNSVLYNVKNLSFQPGIQLQYDIKELVTLEPSYRISYNHGEYSLNDRVEDYTNHTVNFQATSYWPKNFIIGSDLSFQKFGNISSNFKNSFLLWNASLGYKLLGDDGILKVKVFDLLDENTSTSRNIGDDFIQDTEQLVLERYLMVSFTYKLSKFGGKDPNDNKGGWFN